MWACYYAERNSDVRELKRFRLAYWFGTQFYIDVLFDIGTLILFAAATWRLFGIIADG